MHFGSRMSVEQSFGAFFGPECGESHDPIVTSDRLFGMMLSNYYATISNLIEMTRKEKPSEALVPHYESLSLMTFLINIALGGYGRVTQELLGYLDGATKTVIRTVDQMLYGPPFGRARTAT
jgi:hypothetical protein